MQGMEKNLDMIIRCVNTLEKLTLAKPQASTYIKVSPGEPAQKQFYLF
jgi:hypothetical protein